MTYIAFVQSYINKVDCGVPIYLKDISDKLSKEFSTPFEKARASASVAINRLLKNNTIPNLRAYQKGIYYKTKITPFGETNIEYSKLIENKYILPDIGYMTGLSMLHQIGLTSQIPKEITISTNVAKYSSKTDHQLGVVLKQPKTTITSNNRYYFQLLDILDCFDKAPIDIEEPYSIISNLIDMRNLKYDKLLAYADKYYNQKTILELAHVAKYGGAEL